MRTTHLNTLNAAPVEVDPAVILKVGLQEFEADTLRRLRREHGETHVFRRDNQTNRIQSIAVAAGTEPLGESSEEHSAAEVPWLVAFLVTEGLRRFFRAHSRPILSYRPLRVMGRHHDHDLFPADHGLPNWLQKRISFVFDTRLLRLERDKSTVVLACDIRAKHLITADCAELLAQGVPLQSRYVGVLDPTRDLELMPKPRLVGCVREVLGSRLILEDHLEGFATVEAADAYLEPRSENVVWCIRHLRPQEAEQLMNAADGKARALRHGPTRLVALRKAFEDLRQQKVEYVPGTSVRLGSMLSQNDRKHFPAVQILEKPVLVFDPSGSRTGKWNQGGLDDHGPYDQRYFTPKKLRIALISQAAVQGQTEQFLNKFLEGLPDVKLGTPPRAPYAKGFLRRYALETAKVEAFITPTADAKGYAGACRKALQAATDAGQRWDLAVVQINSHFDQLTGDDNPYFVTKALFLKHQVPVQAMTLEKMLVPPSELVYILNNLSIATYAKLGGTPWLLKSSPPIAHELVIGLGSHRISTSRVGGNERVVGITTVFTSDGNYLLDNRTPAVPYDSYANAVLEAVDTAVRTVQHEQNWRTSDAVRLIFHAFKPFKDAEVQAVQAVVRDLGHSQASFAFLHVVDDHPFYIFNELEDGRWFKGARKGVFAPTRGLKVNLSDGEVLLSLSGANEVKDSVHGIPQPTLLRLHRASTFKDMSYLANQAFSFSCHSWRSFFPAPLPITILYSELIAELLSGLRLVSDWDPDAMLGQIGRTRWFL
jgi:Piwi domain